MKNTDSCKVKLQLSCHPFKLPQHFRGAVQQLEQQHHGFVRLRLAVLILGECRRAAAKQSACFGLFQPELFADGTDFTRLRLRVAVRAVS
ncbi:hypothetical protein FACS1894158_03320 [Betaproteobacteria bacterium]|nr:hypothetical protein FACS1894158_03320 [Betaproteobacteria bacterium]